ncbi:hypothetical protein POJ06DRAFT_267256 [Lipomyces tetrasporus]|uniref:Uncharacterized protein n=1 Tax=Lipomyces tetrasporus TaxID=54092 RepID=A0AAD7QTD1_9ASCO|nr:uncharacterized protein POJ06DRAFT_267256 [Lipomyces tetrasporus]KAJ8101090.1 hypothetical protein POJ06DRAFT_267256 [Lipomyces tetrasporus]
MNVLQNRLASHDNAETNHPSTRNTALSTAPIEGPPATLIEDVCALFVITLRLHLGIIDASEPDCEPDLERAATGGSAPAAVDQDDDNDEEEEERNIVANVVAFMMGYLHIACSFLSSTRTDDDVEPGIDVTQPDNRVEKHVHFDDTSAIDIARASSANVVKKITAAADDDDDNEEELEITPWPPRRPQKPLAFEPSSRRKLTDRRDVDTIFAAVSRMRLDRRCTQLEHVEAAMIRRWYGPQFVDDMLRVRRIIQCRNMSAVLCQQDRWKRTDGAHEKAAGLNHMLTRRAREVVVEVAGEQGRARQATDGDAGDGVKMLGFCNMSPEVSSVVDSRCVDGTAGVNCTPDGQQS